jgi:hypothetical protein
MELPFFCPENWLDLTEVNSVRDMGELRIETIKQLGHANGTTGTCTFSIFAWMEGAEICAPTAAPYGTWTYQSACNSTHIEYKPPEESKVSTPAIIIYLANIRRRIWRLFYKEPDETHQTGFGDRPVSRTATAVAKAAGVVSMIPALEPYAKATEMGATALAKFAHLFGFSRPQIVSDITRYKEFPAGQMAPMNVKEAVARLAADDKGELTVDSRTVGLNGVDEMSIPYIVQREAIIHRTDWSEDQARNTALISVNVTPSHWLTDSSALTNFSILPPVSAVSQLFRYWRGTLIFRFRISASAMHRGKLRVSYDPVVNSTSSSMNEVYSRIIDIETNRDFEVPVHWHAYQSWLKVQPVVPGVANTNLGITISNSPSFCNGQITLTVLEPLTSPDPSLGNEVGVDVSIRAGEDMEFAGPTPKNVRRWTFLNPDPDEIPQSAMAADGLQDNMPEGAETMEGIGAGELTTTDMTNLVFMGETITSLRTLMKRYDGENRLAVDAFVPQHYLAHRGPARERLSVHEYITAMFSGKRGSFRHKFVGHSNGQGINLVYTRDTDVLTLDNTFEGAYFNYGVSEIEVPWYSPKRFSSARNHPEYLSAQYRDLDDSDLHRLQMNVTQGRFMDHYIAAGEDHTCFFFVGLPGIYVSP